MVSLDTAVRANRSAVADLIAAAERSRSSWSVPRAPGKWSPSQVVEHVARALEESANVVSGLPSRFPTLPAVLRPVLRTIFFNRVLKRSAFPNARTNAPLNPMEGSSTPELARPRLEAAVTKFAEACLARDTQDPHLVTGVFGKVSLVDYARFQELHTRHHCKQLPGST